MMRAFLIVSFLFSCIITNSFANGIVHNGSTKENQGNDIEETFSSSHLEKVTIRKLDCVAGEECRLMFIYSNECEIPENAHRRSEGAREVHQHIIRIYERRINDAIQRKNAMNGVKQFRNNWISKSIENTTDIYKAFHSEEISMRIRTRYLKSLSMEIVVVPEELTAEEAIELSVDLPCIDFVSPDYVKLFLPYENSVLLSSPLKSELTDTTMETEIASNAQERKKVSNIRSSILEKARSQVNFKAEDANNRTSNVHPNDPLFSLQWYLKENEPYGLKLDSMWQILGEPAQLPEIPVAVIDSGCEMQHPDLENQFWQNPNEICGDGIDNDGNGYIDDCHGWDFVENDNLPNSDSSCHGSAVSGIIAASTNNAIGVAGLCPNCRIMCLRFIKARQGRITDEIAALDYALTNGARISNNSYGGYGGVIAEIKAIEKAKKLQHLFVAAAGNDNKDTDDPANLHSPSSYPLDNILSVGAQNRNGEKSAFSNFGKESVDLLAPGSNIVTIANGGAYAAVYGTSFSAPMATAVAAIIWSKYPSLSYLSVIESMVSTCNRENKKNQKWTRCEGILDVAKFAERAARIAGS